MRNRAIADCNGCNIIGRCIGPTGARTCYLAAAYRYTPFIANSIRIADGDGIVECRNSQSGPQIGETGNGSAELGVTLRKRGLKALSSQFGDGYSVRSNPQSIRCDFARFIRPKRKVGNKGYDVTCQGNRSGSSVQPQDDRIKLLGALRTS